MPKMSRRLERKRRRSRSPSPTYSTSSKASYESSYYSGSESRHSHSTTSSTRSICVFYKRIGACRHGAKCSRLHLAPRSSRTIMIRNLYRYVQPTAIGIASTSTSARSTFEEFYEEVFVELDRVYGSVCQLLVCENLGEHLIGNVYAKFSRTSEASRAVKGLNNRWFAGFPVYAELSPVTNFRDAVCRQHEAGGCSRGGFCNFLHIKEVSTELERKLRFDDGSDDASTSSLSSYYSYASTRSSTPSIRSWSSLSSRSISTVSNEPSTLSSPSSTASSDTLKSSLASPHRTTQSPSERQKLITAHEQACRKLRWQIFQKAFLKSDKLSHDGAQDEWTDDKERQFVFTLLELT